MNIKIDFAEDLTAKLAAALDSPEGRKLRRPIAFTITCADGAFFAGVLGKDGLFAHTPHVHAQLPLTIDLRDADDSDAEPQPKPWLKA